jgi:hypothetical protein
MSIGHLGGRLPSRHSAHSSASSFARRTWSASLAALLARTAYQVAMADKHRPITAIQCWDTIAMPVPIHEKIAPNVGR